MDNQVLTDLLNEQDRCRGRLNQDNPADVARYLEIQRLIDAAAILPDEPVVTP